MNLKSLSFQQLLYLLKSQVNTASACACYLKHDQNCNIPNGALMAIGDFLIYPRFPAAGEPTLAPTATAPANSGRQTSGDGHPIEPRPDTPGRNLESAPALGSSPAPNPYFGTGT